MKKSPAVGPGFVERIQDCLADVLFGDLVAADYDVEACGRIGYANALHVVVNGMSIGVVGFNFGHGSVVFPAFDNDVLYFPSACALFGGDVAEAYAYFLACVGAEVDGGSLGVECPARLAGRVTSPTLVQSVGISSEVTSATTTEI